MKQDTDEKVTNRIPTSVQKNMLLQRKKKPAWVLYVDLLDSRIAKEWAKIPLQNFPE